MGIHFYLFCSSLFCSCCSFKKSNESELLLLFFTEWRERFTLVTLDKKSNGSKCAVFKINCDGSNLLFMKEWFNLFKSDFLQIRSFHHIYILFMPKTTKSESLFIALLTLCKKRELLSSLFTKRAKRGIHSFKRANHSLALSLSKHEQFTRKTKERIPNPGYY